MIEKICARLEALTHDNPMVTSNYILRKDAIEIVQEVSKEYGNDWIPVTERLPEPFQRVLVYDAWDDSMTIEHLQENDSFIDSVVAWMPLPIAPYQKGE